MTDIDTFKPWAPRVGVLPSAARDTICDVAGVTVGHMTLADGPRQTGITVVRPDSGDLFLDRVPAASTVINGFGKSVGLVQLQELGVIETPIALTNTFSVGAVSTAQIRQAIARHPEIGREWATVNPLVMECNDGYLNDIQALALGEADYVRAFDAAADTFAQGSVGAGRGMSCCQLKGGIGSASRVARWDDGLEHTVGVLVLANFGRLANLTVAGKQVGGPLAQRLRDLSQPVPTVAPDKGSIILVLATDAPLDTRQLGRLSRRAAAGLARTGSVYGHGSGDIALAFSTAYRIPYHPRSAMPDQAMLHESRMDALFEAAAESVEQSIIHALWAAETVRGRDGHVRHAVRELWPGWAQSLMND
ncbi:P1 family peptidase [Castellaniella sp. MT123]|uniref:DmpA family aminopeptidase n=1 Tax=Castellaniella sp. MT123 TaxID=3140381 RepID=UPI0031F39770